MLDLSKKIIPAISKTALKSQYVSFKYYFLLSILNQNYAHLKVL